MIDTLQPRTAGLTTALVVCTIDTIAATALSLLMFVVALAFLGVDGSRNLPPQWFAMLFVVFAIGLGCLTGLMWVSLVRLWRGRLRGARPMVWSLGILSSFLSTVVIPPLVNRTHYPLVLVVLGAVVAGSLGGACLLRAHTRQLRP